MRRQVGDLLPVLGRPGAYVAKPVPIPDAPPTPPTPPLPLASARDKPIPEIPKYHWAWLDGRYFYRAKGRENVARHHEEMQEKQGMETLKKIGDRCDKAREEWENTREERAMRRFMHVEEKEG
jgi:hypothetical protein